MQRLSKQTEMHGTEILRMSVCTNKERKGRDTILK